jgi:putative peptide zinc metalloprotease protein
MVLGNHSKITLSPLNIRKDKKHYIVEDVATGEFYEMPLVCIDAISMMNEGKELSDIDRALKRDFPNEEVNVLEFVEDLMNLGIVSTVDGERVSRQEQTSKQSSGLDWISPKFAHIIMNPYSSVFYISTLIVSILLILWKPGLFPSYRDVFLFDLMMYNIFVFLSISFVSVVIHEIGHVLAVRAEGLPTRIEVGHRLFFVVLETDMSRVWSLPSDKRNRLYLAGMYFDSFILLLALLAQIVYPDQWLIVGIAKMIVFSTFIRILFQCCVYMKTDFYYVLENNSGCYNLMENGQNYLKRWLPFIPTVKTSQTFDDEEKLVRPYAVFYLIGVVLTILILVFYNIPLIIHAGVLVLPGFLEPINSVLFWDATVFFLQFVIILGLLSYSWTKKYRSDNE